MTKNPSQPAIGRRVRFLVPLVLAITVAVAMWMIGAVWASYDPSAGFELSTLNSDENPDITSTFEIPSGDVNFDAVVTYTPPEWGVASDADVDNGTPVGTLSTNVTLSLTFTTCSTPFSVDFNMVDATTDTTNILVSTGDISDGSWNGFDDCGGLDCAVEQYPDSLLELYPGAEPRARYFGKVLVDPPFSLWVTIQFLVFEPGTSLGAGIPTTESWGYPSVTVLNDPVAPPAPSALGDFCTPVQTENTIMGTADSVALRTNPPFGGTYIFHHWSRGQPDIDGDGIENAFDTCPYDVNTDTNPRTSRGLDNDAIDVSCEQDLRLPGFDPEQICWPGAPGTFEDCDGDGFANNADTCPLVANPEQEDADEDGIGVECDLNDSQVDGSRPEATIEEPVDIEGPAPGEGTATPTPTPTATAAATATGTVVGTATVTGTPTPTTVAGEGCAPVIPGTYNGLVRLNGVPAPAGYEVTATIDGTEWGSTIVSGGRYALDVPQKLPAAEPCFAGGTITFTIDGGVCEPTEEWASGLHDVDLSCAPAATVTVVPPTTPPPATPPPATPVVTPAKPPVTGSGGLGGDQGLPLWAMVVIGWAGLTALAGFGTLATRIAKR